MEGPVVQVQVMNEETSKTSSTSTGKEAGPAGVSDSVVEYGLISQIIRESGSDHSESNCKLEEPGSKGSRTTKLVPRVDVPDQDINNSGSCTKSGKVESAVNGALHSVCPQESTSVMDVPGDGKTCEMECYVGKSVDEAESGVSMSVTQLLCILGKVNGVPVQISGRQWSQWELHQ